MSNCLKITWKICEDLINLLYRTNNQHFFLSNVKLESVFVLQRVLESDYCIRSAKDVDVVKRRTDSL